MDPDVFCHAVASVVSDCVTLWTVALPGSSVLGVLQARIVDWIAIPFLTQGLNQSLYI